MLFACASTGANHQSLTSSKVVAPAPLAAADAFLSALRDRDTVALRRVIHPAMRLTTASDANDGAALLLTGDDLIRVVARATGAPWVQRFLAPEVRLDGSLAAIWSSYRFDRGDKFDHCGVIALHLVRSQSEWKIIQLSDTHRSTGCAP
jgi:hypothetical protein